EVAAASLARSQMDSRARAAEATFNKAVALQQSVTGGGSLNYYAASPPPAPVAVATAAVESSATSATFKIATPVTLASDGTLRKVAITTASLAPTLQHQATPKLAETAFLSAY